MIAQIVYTNVYIDPEGVQHFGCNYASLATAKLARVQGSRLRCIGTARRVVSRN